MGWTDPRRVRRGVAVGGDGFLAAFAAGMATVVLNYDLCDCFLEYGDVTTEMAMLLALSSLVPCSPASSPLCQ